MNRFRPYLYAFSIVVLIACLGSVGGGIYPLSVTSNESISKKNRGSVGSPLSEIETREVSRYREKVLALAEASSMDQLIPIKIRLENQIKKHPELLELIPETLTEGSLGKRGELALIHILETQKGERPVEILSELALDREIPPHQRMQAIVSLGGRSVPTELGIETLWDIYREEQVSDPILSGAAILNVAVAAGTLSDKEVELGGKVTDQIIEELYNPERKASIGTILDALGNTRSRDILDVTEPLLENSDPVVREEAAYALRRVPGEDVDALLIETASSEENLTARQGAIQALSMREPSVDLIHGIGELLFDESDPQLRRTLIRYLAEHRRRFSHAEHYMAELVTLESDQDNYEMLVTALHSP